MKKVILMIKVMMMIKDDFKDTHDNEDDNDEHRVGDHGENDELYHKNGEDEK